MQPGESPPPDDEADRDADETDGGDSHSQTEPADDDQPVEAGDSEPSGSREPTESDLPDEESFGGTNRENETSTHDGGGADGPLSESDSAGGSAPKSPPSSAPDSAREPAPEPGSMAGAGDTETGSGIGHRFFNDQQGPLMWIREFLSSAAVVLAVGLLLFGISGVWPPMVAVESGSMEPNMEKGDLIFVTEPGRFAPDAATGAAGVVTYEDARDAEYRTFGSYGSVVVFDEPGNLGSPIIHRAHFHVEEGEDWFDRADESHIRAGSCEELRNCPAPESGFITKGDNNPRYDQAQGIAPVVQEEWITGVARLRIPYLGWIRLLATGQAAVGAGIGGLSGLNGTPLLIGGVSAAALGRASRRAS